MNPGLALHITIAPATEAASISQITVTMTNQGTGMFPAQMSMSAPGLKGVSVASDGKSVSMTLSRADGFPITEDFQLLLVPTGMTAVTVNLQGRMFDSSGAQIGNAPESGMTTAVLKPGQRTLVDLPFTCTALMCAPVKGVVNLATPNVTVASYTGDAAADHLTPIAIGSLLSTAGNGDLVLAAPGKNMGTTTKTGYVYIFKSQNWGLPGFLKDNPAPTADLTIIGREGDSLGTAAAIGDVDGDAVNDLVVTGVTAQRPYCNSNIVPPTPCAFDSDCQPNGCMDFRCECKMGLVDVACPSPTVTDMAMPAKTFSCINKQSFAAAGVAYVFSGARLSKLPTGSVLDLNQADPGDPTKHPAYDVTPKIYGAIGQEKLGSSVAVARLSSDANLDVFLGAPGGQNGVASQKPGRIYVMAGAMLATTAAASQSLLTDTGPQILTVLGPSGAAGKAIGSAIAAGDLDGDGYAELAIGNFVDGPASPPMQLGSVYLLRGKTLRSDLNTAPSRTVDLSMTGTFDLKLTGTSQSQFGWTLAMADLEDLGMKTKNLIVAALGINAIFVFPQARINDPTATTVDLASAVTLIGPAGSKFGQSIATGLLDGDNIPDLVVGAPASNGQMGERPGSGAAFVILGSAIKIAATTATRTLMSQDVGVFGVAKMDGLGGHVLCGNLDQSSPTDELIVGADNAGGNNQGVGYALQSLPSQ